VAWIQDVEVTSYLYVLAPDTVQLRGRHRLRPGGLATVIRQVLAPSELGLVPTANSPGSGSQTSPFSLLVRQRGRLQSLPLADFIVPADCSSWELRLRQPRALGGTDVAVVPGGGHHNRLFLSH
jgi:hypothetical protein